MSEKKETTAVSPEEHAELKNLVLEQAAQIKALQAQQAETVKKPAPPPETPKEVFTVGEDKYQFAVPQFILPDRGLVLSADALKDKVILEHLVQIRSGIIRKVQ